MSMIAMLACVLAISVSAGKIGTATDENGLNYTVYDDGTAALKDNRNYSASTTLVIPEKVTYNGSEYTVTATENYAFHSNSTLTAIYFPSTITAIGSHTFSQAPNLKAVYIDVGNLTSIGDCGLTNNSKTGDCNISNWDILFYPTSEYGSEKPVAYKEMYFENLVTLGIACLQGLNVEKVVFGSNLKLIATQSLRKSTMKTLIVNANISAINNWSLAQCGNLETVEIYSNSLATIDTCAFHACSSIKTMKISLSNCTFLGNSAFELTQNCQGGYSNSTTQWYDLNGNKIVDLSACKSLGSEAFGTSNVGSATIIWPKALDTFSDQVFRKANINGQPMYFEASEGKTISITYYAMDGNSPSVVILGQRVASWAAEFSSAYTFVSLNPELKITRSSIFKTSGSTMYYMGLSADSTQSFDRCTMYKLSSGYAVNYGACGIDCQLTVLEDGSNVVVSTPSHTWNDGVINEEYCPIGSVVNFECEYCKEKKTEGEGTAHDHSKTVITYENGFMAKGVKAIKCSNASCCSALEETEEALAIFVFRGYSYSLAGTGSFISSFAVNHSALEAYNNATSERIESYGVFAVLEKNVVNNDPFADGVKNAVVEYFGKQHDIFEMKLSGLKENNDVALFCTAYVTVNGKNLFVDNGELKETLETSVTFDEIVEMVG